MAAATRHFREIYTDAMPEPGSGAGYVLSPDGKQIAFLFGYYNRTAARSEPRICIREVDGTVRFFAVAPWKNQSVSYRSVDWSMDGRRLLFISQGPAPGERTPSAIWSCLLDGTGLRRLTSASVSPEWMSPSPTGRRAAIVQAPPGKSYFGGLSVLDFVFRKTQRLIPAWAYGQPRWSPDGSRLFFFRTSPSRDDDWLETISLNGRVRRRSISRRGMWPVGHSVRQVGPGLLWLSGRFGVMVTMVHALPGSDPGSARKVLWQVYPNGRQRRLGAGEALGQSADGRHLLLKLGGKYWFVELTGPSASQNKKRRR